MSTVGATIAGEMKETNCIAQELNMAMKEKNCIAKNCIAKQSQLIQLAQHLLAWERGHSRGPSSRSCFRLLGK
jgi:hypothetical protein